MVINCIKSSVNNNIDEWLRGFERFKRYFLQKICAQKKWVNGVLNIK